jgi:hypothetical protein
MQRPSDDSRPTPQRLAALAVRVLEEAAVDARYEPIKPTMAHRLALGWLAYCGLSEPWRTRTFWDLLRIRGATERPDGQYCRDKDFARCLNGWRRKAGLPPKADWYR